MTVVFFVFFKNYYLRSRRYNFFQERLNLHAPCQSIISSCLVTYLTYIVTNEVSEARVSNICCLPMSDKDSLKDQIGDKWSSPQGFIGIC